MDYFILPTEVDALAAEALICSNIRAWVLAAVPNAVTEDGAIRSRSAVDGSYTDAKTTRWAIPRETADGQWAFIVPDQTSLEPVPLAAALAGVDVEPQPEPTWPQISLAP